MPRRAILLLIATASVLVSTTLGASAEPKECAGGCGGYFRIPQGATYSFSAKATAGGYPLDTEAWLATGTVVQFDARLTTTGLCREVWCNPSPHCGRGSDLNDLYNTYGLWIEDENGDLKAGFWDDTEQSIGSTPEHPTKITLNQPGTYHFRIKGHMDPTECRFTEWTPTISYVFHVEDAKPCFKCSIEKTIERSVSNSKKEQCFTDMKAEARDRCKHFLEPIEDDHPSPEVQEGAGVAYTWCWTREYFGGALNALAVPIGKAGWGIEVALSALAPDEALRPQCVKEWNDRSKPIQERYRKCREEAACPKE